MAAETAISSAVQLLGDLLIQKVKFVRGVEGKVELLKDELNRMQSFLKDANKKQAQDERVRNWVSEIREVAQDAQDAIEMFLLNIQNHPRRSCTSFSKRIYYIDRIGEEIESIQARVDAIHKSRERYGIRDLGEAAEDHSTWRSQLESRRRLAPWKTDEHLVGLEDDVRKLLRELILVDGKEKEKEKKKGLSMAAIVGMGGIGKSTLARTIYNHPDVVVAGRFDCRAWVVVSGKFTPHETIKQLLLGLPRSDQDKERLREEIKKLEGSTEDKLYLQQELQQMLHEQLEGKTYFIVLDDVWEKEHWEFLTSAFPDEQDKSSRLLVTSRNKVIAKHGQYAHEMKLLDPEESWKLLLKKAFVDKKSDDKFPKDLESIGRKILEKCDGLPLAISMVGGLLLETQTKSGWEEVLNQINSHLGRAESSVSAILELSYQNLSFQLKSCFLCLAFFKEDTTIPAKRLIHIWVGHGLIQQEGRRMVEEIARGYLDELINRNLVQIEDLNMDDRVKSCHLHDLLREVCLRKAKEEIGFRVLKEEEEDDIISSQSLCKPRNHVVHGENIGTLLLKHNKHLRSLFLINLNGNNNDVRASTPSPYWKSFYLLKILDLNGFKLRTLPRSFRALVGLKCFRIRRVQHKLFPEDFALFMGRLYEPMKLPRWLDRLKNLEVLDMENEFVEFPNVTLKMGRLRHFHANCVYSSQMRIENWKNIETLKYISQKDWLGCSSKLMPANCCHVRELGIYMDGEKRKYESSKVRASLEKMENLAKLHLMWSLSHQIDTAIIPSHLTKLKLTGEMSKCLALSTLPSNLSYLTLESAHLDEDPMPELGKLPKLMHLKLKRDAYVGKRMRVLHDGFPCLEALFLRELYGLRGIHIEEGGMPQLKQLKITQSAPVEINNLPKRIHV
ncbi:hypothetical protein C2S53_010306 [Perilla frutescens var. hirtella]|uniref:Uncharacterized protein n=1 Tax=Perilla frutescens var. hirtella TaxID=608512 RepID=A0AAD4IQZ3_PERFH|nr:hypothetical protein C2S53_010306 [Perilla frutescens var. hirtella]